ncbi:MAG: hypothetical protein J6Y13_11710 [Treponema sp.]|nr:hypothetical protein [Treponema sp.]
MKMRTYGIALLCLALLALCAATAGKLRDKQAKDRVIWKNHVKYRKFNGTPENTVIFYGGFHGGSNDLLFRQIDPEQEPDAQGVSEEEFFISEPVRFGTRYMLEYWYWTDTTDTFEGNAVARDYTEQNSPLIIDIPYEPGFYYFGYYDGRPSIIKGELTEWNGHPSVEMKPEAIRKALKYYGGSAWAPRLRAELKQAEAEAKKHKAERKAANRKSMWLDDSDSAPEQAQD